MIDIDQIRTDGGTQSRAAICQATVEEYAEAMADPDRVFPPVTVYFDGRNYWLADGFHRLEAWRQIGRAEIPAEVRQGNVRAAILHSVKANSAHGLRRSNADKRRAVTTLLEDGEWSQWSNREIARRCAVSDVFVAAVRADLSANGLQMEQVRKVERGGVVYQQNTANIGAGSKADQEESGPQTIDEEHELPAEPQQEQGAREDDQESDLPDPHAKMRRALAAFTRQGLEDELIGTREALREERAKRKKAEAENKRLRENLADFDGEQADTIRRLQKQIEHLRSEMFRANEKTDAALRQAHAVRKEAHGLRQQVENQIIPLGGAA